MDCRGQQRFLEKGYGKRIAVRRQEHDDEAAKSNGNETDATLEISPEIQRRIKRSAAENNLSVEEYLERIIEQAEKEDILHQKQRKSLTQEKLAELFRAIEEIQQHTQGQIFDDPVEVIRKMREERLRELGFSEYSTS